MVLLPPNDDPRPLAPAAAAAATAADMTITLTAVATFEEYIELDKDAVNGAGGTTSYTRAGDLGTRLAMTAADIIANVRIALNGVDQVLTTNDRMTLVAGEVVVGPDGNNFQFSFPQPPTTTLVVGDVIEIFSSYR